VKDGGSDASLERPPDMGDVYDELRRLKETVDTNEERELVEGAIELVVNAERRTFGRVVSGFDHSDAAQALLGILLFGIPMFVEGGTQEVGSFHSSHPLYWLATLLVTLGAVVGIPRSRMSKTSASGNPIFGLTPGKFSGVVGVAALTAAEMMTLRGRVDWALAPWVALCDVTVAFLPMTIGAALSDLLPGPVSLSVRSGSFEKA
jgi:hypothetical protein